MKYICKFCLCEEWGPCTLEQVAPLAGAWIETVDNIRPVRWEDEKDVVIREQPGLKKVDHNITYDATHVINGDK